MERVGESGGLRSMGSDDGMGVVGVGELGIWMDSDGLRDGWMGCIGCDLCREIRN